jgi:hypothetical protein
MFVGTAIVSLHLVLASEVVSCNEHTHMERSYFLKAGVAAARVTCNCLKDVPTKKKTEFGVTLHGDFRNI